MGWHVLSTKQVQKSTTDTVTLTKAGRAWESSGNTLPQSYARLPEPPAPSFQPWW